VLIMKATLRNIRDVLGIHAKGVQFIKKENPTNGYILRGFLDRNSLNDLDHNFHIYIPRSGGLAVITPGRLNVSQKDL